MLRTLGPLLNDTKKDLNLDASGALPAGAWEKIPADRQDLLYEHLLAARDGLETAVDVDGPAERTSIMFKTFASNQWVIVLTALAVAATVGILFWIVTIWPGAIPQGCP